MHCVQRILLIQAGVWDEMMWVMMLVSFIERLSILNEVHSHVLIDN